MVLTFEQQDDDTVTGNRMSVFFYSQTGTAEDFSRRLADDGKLYGFHTKVYDVEEFDTVRYYMCFNLRWNNELM